MKKVLFSLLILVFTFSILLPSIPKETTKAEEIEKNIITVYGEAKIMIEPDVAYLNLSIETVNKNLSVAQSENAKNMAAVLNTLAQNEIANEQIKTTGFNVYPEYDYLSSGSVFKHYKVSNSISVKITNLPSIGSLINSLSQNAITRINGIDFCLENQTATYKIALENAIENAKAKAATLASTATLSNLKIINIKELQTHQNAIFTRDAVMYSAKTGTQTQIFAGNLTISATVEVAFEF